MTHLHRFKMFCTGCWCIDSIYTTTSGYTYIYPLERLYIYVRYADHVTPEISTEPWQSSAHGLRASFKRLRWEYSLLQFYICTYLYIYMYKVYIYTYICIRVSVSNRDAVEFCYHKTRVTLLSNVHLYIGNDSLNFCWMYCQFIVYMYVYVYIYIFNLQFLYSGILWLLNWL